MSAHETEELTSLRRELLADLSGRVLEVGAGTGTNFAHYPTTVTQVVAVEPEAQLFRRAQAAAAAALVPVTVTPQPIEALDADSESFDAVVCSLVLCTVDNPDAVVQQIFTVLKPGGQLRYMEHVASGGWRNALQQIADATLWPRLFGGCHTHRYTESAICAAGFAVTEARRQWTMPRWAPMPVAEFALGRAIKPR